MSSETARFQFIGHALHGDGPFRPKVQTDGMGAAVSVGSTYLVQYPRESLAKFARRNELAWYASPLARACSRFVGYVSTRTAVRDLTHDLYSVMADDVDGKGNAIDVFWLQFMQEAKARGSMLLLVDMPNALAPTMASQLATRTAPYWTVVAPELLTDYSVGDDGKFDFAEFSGTFKRGDDVIPCTWHFDREEWKALDREKKVLDEGAHPLGECPLLIFTEGADFPSFGPFAAIADLSKRLFNLDSELDEILRAQTFSLLTMQVPDDSTSQNKLDASKVAGETIGTANLLVHTGSTPAFIAPPDGPARVYLDRIDKLRMQIDEIGLNVANTQQQESGIAMQMRFQTINGELTRFSVRMEDLESRAWDLSRKWLQMTAAPTVTWPRDFNLADVQAEMAILTEMQGAAMPQAVIEQQQSRIVALQFGGLDQESKDRIASAITERSLELT